MRLVRKKLTHTHSRKTTTANAFFWKQTAKGVGVVVVVAFVVYGVHVCTSADIFAIDTIVVSGGETIQHENVKADIEQVLQGSYLGIIPKRFAYTYPQGGIKEKIEQDPRVYNVAVVRTNRKELSVSFDEYVPVALWCVYGKDTEPCFYITANGYAFMEAPSLQGGALMRFYTDKDLPIIRETVIPSETLANLSAFSHRVSEAFGFNIVSMVVHQNGDVECTIAGGGVFHIALKNDTEKTFMNIKALLASKAYAHIKPGNFKYIDARFDNKLFVNEALVHATTSSPETTSSEVVKGTDEGMPVAHTLSASAFSSQASSTSSFTTQ